MQMPADKTCPVCDELLVRRAKETPSAFKKRKTCNRACASKLRERGGERIYSSRFGGGYLTGAQYITENMCDRSARRNGMVLPERFWDKDQWKGMFFVQLKHANALVGKYSVQAIIAALRTPQGKRVYSLGATWLRPLIHNEQERLNRANACLVAVEPQAQVAHTSEPPRQPFTTTKSIMSTLKGI